ncbi:DUF2268 domain-containing putative Zn-dependent protease [Paracoccus sp. Ld10]|uniref:DUF2268 domain-containing putative Zn-dependent protease n=1 Tax=Paracoccus sp. Ld10 TaxID=649158 RepID=UPI0038640315
MTIWQLHMLNARSALTPIMAEIRAHAREMVAAVEAHLDLPRFDLVVRAGDAVSPEWGIAGHAPSPGIIEITLDPARVAPEHFRRTLVHEMHHLTRWDGPGYGRSLGEALVSEGLAGHFVQQVLGGPADPWDQTRPVAGTLKQAAALWARRDYDHGEWFLGRGRMRKWVGHGIAHRVVAEHLAMTEGESAASLVWRPADDFRAAMRRMMASAGIEDEAEAPTADGPADSATVADDPAATEPLDGTVAAGSDGQIACRDAWGQAPRTPQEG